jgi:hypothetical protein
MWRRAGGEDRERPASRRCNTEASLACPCCLLDLAGKKGGTRHLAKRVCSGFRDGEAPQAYLSSKGQGKARKGMLRGRDRHPKVEMKCRYIQRGGEITEYASTVMFVTPPRRLSACVGPLVLAKVAPGAACRKRKNKKHRLSLP